MLTAYGIIFLKVFLNRKRSTLTSYAGDCRLAFQFTVICLFQWFSAFFFYMVPRVFGTTAYGVMATNVCGILNTSINPIVLFLFNSRIQNGIKKRWKSRNSTVVSSINHQEEMTLTRSAWVASVTFRRGVGSSAVH
ncbi:hypothetical protein L596_022519 [Steinernema carpocapsae]|uniref:G-protein coupled receptors family 1 profile domain-containing protein n=1 Tax=Steinernema carpocapsae TaxID=34508 RepID=A0A4U5MLX4_STECR|nr:hypothetical protein L596_022519 [Steinernema carpocapsae]